MCAGFDTVRSWALKVCAEFTAQADRERELGLPVTAFMLGLDNEVSIAKLQLGFLDYVVGPLWKAVSELFPETAECHENLKANRERWAKIKDGGTAETEP